MMACSVMKSFFIFILFFSECDGFRSDPEVLTDIETKPCFAQDRLQTVYPDDSLGSLFEVTDRQFCVTGKTNKSNADYEELQKSDEIVTVTPNVIFRWTKLGYCIDCATVFCPIKYHGYQETYRISPDFGYYKECNSQLSKYRHEVAKAMNKAVSDDSVFTFPFRYGCPIKELPLKFERFSMCSLKSDHWYLFEYRSINEIELRNKTTMLISHNNFWILSTHSVFYHDAGHEKVYQLKTKIINCAMKVLTLAKHNLPFDVKVELKMSSSPESGSLEKRIEYNFITMNDASLWDGITYHFSTNYSIYSVDFCYRGFASVQIGSRNITAFISNGNQWLCFHNRIHCFPPPTAKSGTNVNWSNRKLVMFLVFVIRYNVLFTPHRILN